MFHPSELKQSEDGWELYKKKKFPLTMVKRYNQCLDYNYNMNKVTVCAHINHIFDLYLV